MFGCSFVSWKEPCEEDVDELRRPSKATEAGVNAPKIPVRISIRALRLAHQLGVTNQAPPTPQ